MTTLIHFGLSDKKNKRYVAKFENPKRTTHFGMKPFKKGTTYLDGATDEKRNQYLARHKVDLATKDPTRAGFLSYYVIWGKSRSVKQNLKSYLSNFKIKDNRKNKN
tara:strand:- start:239 stop:556 length:318 start_codon:yes stop_codon:yes gene_type:complete